MVGGMVEVGFQNGRIISLEEEEEEGLMRELSCIQSTRRIEVVEEEEEDGSSCLQGMYFTRGLSLGEVWEGKLNLTPFRIRTDIN
jgi:hypothetical protein